MDFGEILDEWDRIKRVREEDRRSSSDGRAGAHALENWLAANEVRDKDAESDSYAARGADAKRLEKLKAQDVLDLHGMSAEEAKASIRAFIDAASRAGLEKVLIIHGKGLHSEGAPVLKKATREALEAHPRAGRFGEAAKAEGGSGAVWVLIRSKK
jgi:Uncharacterized protein conserved in bacteria